MRQILFLVTLVAAFFSSASGFSATSRPKLVFVIVFDQMRADYLTRFEKRFLPAKDARGHPGGFEYLMKTGAYFPLAQYELLQNMTCPGHATVLTGSYPYLNGISINYWYEDRLQDYVYCAEDREVPTVGAKPKSPHVGTSPRNLNGTTFGDELKNAGYPSRVVSIAIKDRAAIMLGGHRADLALWMDSESFRWVSSRYYLKDGKLPEWIEQLNAGLQKRVGQSYVWSASGKNPGTGYSANSSFSHSEKIGDKKSLASPLGLELTANAVESAIRSYGLGNGPATDVLAVSFSSHDYVGHAMGPNSREMEEMTVAEDRILSRLLNRLRQAVPGGLDQVLVVLTGDHGAPPVPEWAKEHGLDAGRIDDDGEVLKNLNAALEEKFGKPGKDRWVVLARDFNVYLNRKAIAETGKDYSTIEKATQAFLEKVPGIRFVVSRSDYEARRFPPGMLADQTMRSFIPGRNGDLVFVPKPFYITGGESGTDHLTSYSYDRMVPLALAGFGIRKGIYSTLPHIVDIAPTLSFLNGVIPPALSEGRVLTEALQGQKSSP